MSLSRRIWLAYFLASSVIALYLIAVGLPEIGLAAIVVNAGCTVIGIWKDSSWL